MYSPSHSLRALLRCRSNLAQLPTQLTNRLDRIACILGESTSDELPNRRSQSRSLAIGANHDLQRAISVHAAKVEVALRWDISDIGSNLLLLA